jgi:hypothetical protein
MTCKKCNASIPEEKSFCPNCGHFNEPIKAKRSELFHAFRPKAVIPFTSQYTALGFLLWGTLTVLLVGFFYYSLFKYPLVPALQSNWLYMHIPLGLIAYSAFLGALIISIITSFNNDGMPKVVFKLQIMATLLFSACVISGAVWAEQAWGKYWTWDPKETWSLILLCILLVCSAYMVITTPYVHAALAVLSIEVSSVIFVYLVNVMFFGLHSYNYMLPESTAQMIHDMTQKLLGNEYYKVLPIVAGALGLIPAFIVQQKGYRFIPWWLYGSALFIVSLPHALFMKAKQTATE